MTKLNEELFNEIKTTRRKNLRGLILDIYYLNHRLSKYNKDELEDEKTEEEKKLERDKDGRVIKDERDVQKLRKINWKLEKIKIFEGQLEEHTETKADVIEYLKLVNDAPDELLEQLDAMDELEYFKDLKEDK